MESPSTRSFHNMIIPRLPISSGTNRTRTNIASHKISTLMSSTETRLSEDLGNPGSVGYAPIRRYASLFGQSHRSPGFHLSRIKCGGDLPMLLPPWEASTSQSTGLILSIVIIPCELQSVTAAHSAQGCCRGTSSDQRCPPTAWSRPASLLRLLRATINKTAVPGLLSCAIRGQGGIRTSYAVISSERLKVACSCSRSCVWGFGPQAHWFFPGGSGDTG
jgi:hypothetical protein